MQGQRWLPAGDEEEAERRAPRYGPPEGFGLGLQWTGSWRPPSADTGTEVARSLKQLFDCTLVNPPAQGNARTWRLLARGQGSVSLRDVIVHLQDVIPAGLLREHVAPTTPEVVCYGVGRFGSSRTARWHLALLLAIVGQCRVCDLSPLTPPPRTYVPRGGDGICV